MRTITLSWSEADGWALLVHEAPPVWPAPPMGEQVASVPITSDFADLLDPDFVQAVQDYFLESSFGVLEGD